MNTTISPSTQIVAKATPLRNADSLQIIVADDEPLIREFVAKVCRHFGHQVVAVAENGRELADLCLTTKPDLIITDIVMPEVDGLTALELIRKTMLVRSIVISAHDHPDLRAKAKQLGACAYLVKPIGISDLGPALTLAASG